MVKVLYVFGGEKASGAEIVVERLISTNITRVEPHLFVSPGRFADNLIAAGRTYPIITIDRLRKLNRSSTGKISFLIKALSNYFSISYYVIKYIRRNNINYIHANTVVPASYLIPAIIFSKFFYPSKVWFWSDHDLKYFSKFDTIFARLSVSLYDITFAVSEAVKKKYEDNKSVVVLYNGLDPDIFKTDIAARLKLRERLKLSTGSIVLGIAGTISPRKGQLELIKVFSQLSVAVPDLFLVVSGGFGDDDERYNTEVTTAMQQNRRVAYIGHVTDMVEFYNGCDIIISNSTLRGSEPLGTTIYEAMACERIVVAANTGGTAEIIDDQIDGFLFEPENEQELKKSLELVIRNITSFDQLRLRARNKVKEKFSLPKMADNYNYYIQSSLKNSNQKN